MVTDYLEVLKEEDIPPKYNRLMKQFYLSYLEVLRKFDMDPSFADRVFPIYLARVKEQIAKPYKFEPYHRQVLEPFDYYQFGTDLIGGLVDRKESTALNRDLVDQMEAQMAQGDNVVLLANHQTESDPQVISILLEQSNSKFGQDLIFVAGERVITDPMAIPFSLGCNLLCIYSKKYMNNSDGSKLAKHAHNRRTMKQMAALLKEGGKAIYVAPSGGRDRADEDGVIRVAKFDSQAIEMFRLMTSHSKRPCHFYPLALASYNILPPPHGLGDEIGEVRYTNGGSVHLAFGPEIDFEICPGGEIRNKQERRQAIAHHLWKLVNDLYEQLPQQVASEPTVVVD